MSLADYFSDNGNCGRTKYNKNQQEMKMKRTKVYYKFCKLKYKEYI